MIYNGGQKCWDLSSNISKTSPKQSWIFSKISGNECFFGLNITGDWGDDVLMSFTFLKELKADHKIAVRSRVLRYYVITWKGFFTQSQVLSSSIVWNWLEAIKWNLICHLLLQNYRKTFALVWLKCSFFGKMLFIRCRWSACCAKELGCSAWTFSFHKQNKVIIWKTCFWLTF